MEDFRGVMRENESSVYMCKNSLMVKACEQVEGWEGLKEIAKVWT